MIVIFVNVFVYENLIVLFVLVLLVLMYLIIIVEFWVGLRFLI